MTSLDGVSWNPCCETEVERPKLDRVSTDVGVKVKSRPKSGTCLKKFSQNQSLHANTKIVERKLSDKHKSTPQPDKNQPKS